MGKNIEKYYTFLKKCSTVVVTVHSWAVHCAARPQANTGMGPESGLLP